VLYHISFSLSGGTSPTNINAVVLSVGLFIAGCFGLFVIGHCCKKGFQSLTETDSEVLPLRGRRSAVAFIRIPRQAPLTGSATTLTIQQMNQHTVQHRHIDINESNTRHSGPESESRHVSENAHINTYESLHVNIDELPPSYESVMNAEVNSVHM